MRNKVRIERCDGTYDKRDEWAASLGLKESKAEPNLANVVNPNGKTLFARDEITQSPLYDHPRIYNHDTFGRVLTIEPYLHAHNEVLKLVAACESHGLTCDYTHLSPYYMGGTMLITIYKMPEHMARHISQAKGLTGW